MSVALLAPIMQRPTRMPSSSTVDVTVLGSSDAFCSGGHLNAAYLVEAGRSTFLIDCGPTILTSLKQRGIDSERIDFVVVSHLHGDHFGGVPFLLLEYMYERPRTRPFLVVGPPGIEQRTWELFRALYRDIETSHIHYELRFQELVPETPAQIADVRVLPVRVPHQVDDVALALRFEVGGKCVLYSGDSPWIERFVELARGCDLFLCECTSFAGSMGRHIEWEQLKPLLGRLASRRLVLVHLGREMRVRESEITPECAAEGMVIRL
jgi:ribonuclease BN (tRNA processing enzyme)